MCSDDWIIDENFLYRIVIDSSQCLDDKKKNGSPIKMRLHNMDLFKTVAIAF